MPSFAYFVSSFLFSRKGKLWLSKTVLTSLNRQNLTTKFVIVIEAWESFYIDIFQLKSAAIHSFIYSFVHLFIHPFIHSLILKTATFISIRWSKVHNTDRISRRTVPFLNIINYSCSNNSLKTKDDSEALGT